MHGGFFFLVVAVVDADMSFIKPGSITWGGLRLGWIISPHFLR